ncbi:hypothetical protein KL953_25305 [Mycolicibacterium goodii]|uniref:hypothetical protein n=1 Tax=Mycolicibacterium goodii TaxID=134601 RepID=UPI001BDCD924|nr:hypothetical protein [Mycolicibacterium goodii]MBU8812211.1 hypothetical protein [Mycolicibacterium goodii]
MPYAQDTFRSAAGTGSLTARLTARVCAGRYDDQLSLGFVGKPGSPQAIHAARLESDRERQCIARTLGRFLTDAHEGRVWITPRVPVHAANISAAAATIHEVIERLLAPRPVDARGVARLRKLLADGAGPLYLSGVGDLEGRLRAAMAAM